MPATVVDHLVLLKLLDPRNTAELTSAIQTLSTLPGVKSITCGPTFVPNGSDDRRGGYNYAITCRFANRAALQNYAEHADHLAVKRDFIAPNLDKSQPNPVLAVDFSATRAVGPASSGSATPWKIATVTWVAVAAVLFHKLRQKN